MEGDLYHKNWPLLMAEGAMQLSAITNVDFIPLVKVGDNLANFFIEVVVLGRATAAVIAAAARNKLCGQKNADPRGMPQEQLETLFDVRLLARRVLRRGEIQANPNESPLDSPGSPHLERSWNSLLIPTWS